jgi:hypothetical protein
MIIMHITYKNTHIVLGLSLLPLHAGLTVFGLQRSERAALVSAQAAGHAAGARYGLFESTHHVNLGQ